MTNVLYGAQQNNDISLHSINGEKFYVSWTWHKRNSIKNEKLKYKMEVTQLL